MVHDVKFYKSDLIASPKVHNERRHCMHDQNARSTLLKIHDMM